VGSAASFLAEKVEQPSKKRLASGTVATVSNLKRTCEVEGREADTFQRESVFPL